MIDKILKQKVFTSKPPVLVDVGASGYLHRIWKEIAKYSICIGFDANYRETEFVENENKTYKKLYVFHKIVAEDVGKKDFYLTKSPYCSSTLKPNHESLKYWAFADLFNVEKVVCFETVDIRGILKKLDIDYIDWFKTDSQGTDLRIFNSLEKTIIGKIIVADFEPGMMDAYFDEDKLHTLMKFMEDFPFWICDMVIEGTQRIKKDTFDKYFNKLQKKYFWLLLKKSPFWSEISYFNNLEIFDQRDLLLGCAFALIKKQYGFAIDLSLLGQKKFNNSIFKEIEDYAVGKIKNNSYKIFIHGFKRILQKLMWRK